MGDFNETVDGKLTSRMRKVNPEQFLTLVKMHLSFELDINTEDNDTVTEKAKLKKWGILSFSKKPKSMMNLQQKCEGLALTTEGIGQIKTLIQYLSKNECINQEGIFRRTGKLTRQQELKLILYQGQPLDLEAGAYSVHDCASVLKGFLAELPEPLLTDLHYPAYCQIAELCNPNTSTNEPRLLSSLQLLLLLLPSANRILLKYLLNLLNKTASHENNNKMNCDTLATLFTPHLMCPRKLTPEALHLDSQNLSGIVAFMIRKGNELFEIPIKLATDIRAYWVDQERKLLSPNKYDPNESVSDTGGTAHTVFSFVDHKLTAKANITEDTQAALAQLYAHIQAMPESAKKRRLVKQFNKENGRGTPRHVKQVRTKSLGDSIKKHIFQKKLLGGHKKVCDINIGCDMSRSSSEENILSMSHKTSLPPKVLFSKSDDELSTDSFVSLENENLVQTKTINNSTGSMDICKNTSLVDENKIINDNSNDISVDINKVNQSSIKHVDNPDINKKNHTEFDRKFRRHNSEPPDMYSSIKSKKNTDDVVMMTERRKSNSVFSDYEKSTIKLMSSLVKSLENNDIENINILSNKKIENSNYQVSSPVIKNKFLNVYDAHTSTPSDLLRRNLTNSDYGLTPLKNNDRSMSPITQSTSKMTKAMQETMMTPRSRKPVIMLSGSNLCNLASIKNGQSSSQNYYQIVNIDIDGQNSLNSISEESENIPNTYKIDSQRRPPFVNRNYRTPIENDYCTTIPSNSISITSTFREYLLSRSVLTASPVDLSFSSRTGDFEQSESDDLNILDEKGLSDSLLNCLDGNNPPSSDTSGIASGSTNSANNSNEKIDDVKLSSPRKRGTSLQRNDSKRSIKDNENNIQNAINKQCSKTSIDSDNINENFQETSF